MYKALIILLRRKTSIRFRIYLFAGVMLFLFYFASIFSFFTHLNDVKEEKRKSLQFIVTEVLTKTAAQALWRGSKDQLDSVIQTLIESTEIKKIIVYDDKGEVFIFKQLPDLSNSTITTFNVDVYWKKLSAEFSSLDTDQDSVADQRVKVGSIEVEIDQDAISAIVWSAMIDKSYAIFVALILSMPIAYILAMSLVRPLKGIMGDLQRFESGDYPVGIGETKYRDEYALLSTALARAGVSIKKKTDEIEKANEDLKRHSQELEAQVRIAIEARKSADEANARKDIFVANITHEFKRPLTGVVSGLDLIEHGIYEILSEIDEIDTTKNVTVAEKIKLRDTIFKLIKSIDAAKYGSTEITAMVSEILASIQDFYDDVKLVERPVRIVEALMQLVKSNEIYAKQKGLSFRANFSECDKDVWVIADWIRVAQVINSLIGNAIKFTERGAVSVSIRMLPTTDNLALFIEVQDTGIGISTKEKDAIFNLFHIGQHPRSKIAPGIGTGLAIAKKISEKLGGTISLKSSSQRSGSCFSFECTFKRADDRNIVSIEKVAQTKDVIVSRNVNLLYVEDSIVNQMIFQQYCIRHGVDLVMASNGDEGYEKYLSGNYDALVVDCYMPLGDGFALVSKIRELEEHRGTSRSLIFALTADDSDKNRRRCMKYGFDEFVTKPYTNDVYVTMLQRVAQNSGR